MKVLILLLVCSIIFNLKTSSKEIKICDNGGISLNNYADCICPYSYIGSNCENKNSNETFCSDAVHPKLPFGSLCCWQKYRTITNLTEMKYTTGKENELKSDNDKIIEIFKMYGPWRERDIQLSNILFDKTNTNNEYHLKYNNFNIKYQKAPHSCQDIENPIAFTLMVHKIDLESINQLLEILYKPYHYYIIHVDKSMQDEELLLKLNEYITSFQKVKKINSGYENYPNNLKVMTERFYGSWGSISLVYMELASYASLFDMVKERSSIVPNVYSRWSHVINLSINDIPTISITNLSKHLCENYNTNYIDENLNKEIDRFNKTYIDYQEGLNYFEPMEIDKELFEMYQCGTSGMLNYYDRKLISDGSQWHILTFSYANYLIGNIKSIEKLFSFKFSNIPDETFYQSSKKFYPLINEEVFTGSHRITYWENNPNRIDKYRYGVFLEDVDNINHDTFFIRKVYTQDVKDAIIKKFNLYEYIIKK